VWKFKTEGIMLASSPVYWNGRIYTGSYDYNLYCMDAKTGELAWRFRTEGEVNALPFIDGGRVYFASKDQNVYCVDAKTGALLWKFRTQDQINACPSVVDGKVYIGSFDRNVYCLDASRGTLIWKFETQGEIHTQNPTLVHKNVVYIPSFDNYLYALTADKGKMIWRFQTGIYGNTASPVLHKDVLYLDSRDGLLFAIGLDGKELWRVRKNTMFSMPAVFEDRIYVGGDDMIMHCLELSGKELWKFQTQGVVWMQVVFLGRTAYFSSWDCNMYAVDIDTHELVWKFRASGSPSDLAPPHESFEFVMKIHQSDMEKEVAKRYDFLLTEEGDDAAGAYKSKVTYRVSTQYAARGKYQVDSDEERF
jgi:outer membrane protein assembly factor BamB